jgi:Fe-S cluster biogenesis protein NfuA/nitrite reductase/ring-hydroxylating ferredoxin subunit
MAATLQHDAPPADPVGRVEALLDDVERLPDPRARETATELVQALLELYGEGLARLVDHLAERDADGALAEALAGDELVAHLLLLHGLHPVPLEARVRGALEEVSPYLESHGGGVELLGIEDGVVRVRLAGSCDGCPSSAMTLKLAIEDAVHAAAPDVERIEAEGAVAEAAPPPRRAWVLTDAVPQLDGAPLTREVAGEELLFLRLDHKLYAYRSACAGCGRSLAGGTLHGTELACPACGHRYDVRRAGRCVDEQPLHLDPVPLLVDEDGRVKLALGTPTGA